MRKITLGFTLLTLLVLACSSLSGCTPPGGATPTPQATSIPGSLEVTATLRTYQDPDGYFTIGYPPDWKVSAADRQVQFIEPYGKLSIRVQYTDMGQVLDEAGLRTLIDNYFNVDEGLGVSHFTREKEVVQSNGSILVEYTLVTSVPGHGSSLFQQQGTYVYILSFWVQQEDLWAANKDFFDTVTQTFSPTLP